MYNPEFTAWHQQDVAILTAIMTTSTEEIQGIILFVSSCDAWSKLEASFASQMTARSIQICGALQKCEKLDSSIAVYFNKVKALADTLMSIGQPLRPEEFTGYLLNGLDADYDALVQVVYARALTNPMPIRDVYAQMLSTEQRMEGRKAQINTDMHMSANYGSRTTPQGGKQVYQQNYRSDDKLKDFDDDGDEGLR